MGKDSNRCDWCWLSFQFRPEVPIFGAHQNDRGLWERDSDLKWLPNEDLHNQACAKTINWPPSRLCSVVDSPMNTDSYMKGQLISVHQYPLALLLTFQLEIETKENASLVHYTYQISALRPYPSPQNISGAIQYGVPQWDIKFVLLPTFWKKAGREIFILLTIFPPGCFWSSGTREGDGEFRGPHLVTLRLLKLWEWNLKDLMVPL